jgi:hypothetical protein
VPPGSSQATGITTPVSGVPISPMPMSPAVALRPMPASASPGAVAPVSPMPLRPGPGAFPSPPMLKKSSRAPILLGVAVAVFAVLAAGVGIVLTYTANQERDTDPGATGSVGATSAPAQPAEPPKYGKAKLPTERLCPILDVGRYASKYQTVVAPATSQGEPQTTYTRAACFNVRKDVVSASKRVEASLVIVVKVYDSVAGAKTDLKATRDRAKPKNPPDTVPDLGEEAFVSVDGEFTDEHRFILKLECRDSNVRFEASLTLVWTNPGRTAAEEAAAKELLINLAKTNLKKVTATLA